MIAGSRSFAAIGQWAADACPEVLAALGAARGPAEESTFRRAVEREAYLGGMLQAGPERSLRARWVMAGEAEVATCPAPIRQHGMPAPGCRKGHVHGDGV